MHGVVILDEMHCEGSTYFMMVFSVDDRLGIPFCFFCSYLRNGDEKRGEMRMYVLEVLKEVDRELIVKILCAEVASKYIT